MGELKKVTEKMNNYLPVVSVFRRANNLQSVSGFDGQ